MRAKEFIIEAIPLDQLRAMGNPESQDSKDLAARLRQSMPSKPRNFVSKNAKMGGAGAHKDKKKAEKQGDFKHKKSPMPMESALRDKEDYRAKRKALDDLGRNKDVDQKAVQQRRLDLDKEAKQKGVEEGVFSFLKAEPAPKKKWDSAKDSRAASNYKNNDDSWVKLLIDKHRRGIPLTDREWNSIEQWKLKRAMRGEASEIQELSTDKLALYKKAAGADAKKADADGDYARGDKRFKGINRATNKQFDNDLKKHGQKDVAERVRDPEDWDEGNTEPANNFAVYINGKKWKVFKGRGRYADDNREQAHYQQLKDWAAKKSADTGKKWTVSITGEAPTE
jgi:hypothetical protein